MYLDQKIRITSPLVDVEIRKNAEELSVILGDSSLLCNIALLYRQGVMYKNDNHIQLVARSFGDAAPPDMLHHYSLLTGLQQQALRDRLAQQVYDFINSAARFFLNNPTLQPLFAELKSKKLYITTDRVSDDVATPFIDVKICRG